jgi:hypothetical protein
MTTKTDDEILDLMRKFVAMNNDPQYGIGMWHVMCCQLLDEITDALIVRRVETMKHKSPPTK